MGLDSHLLLPRILHFRFKLEIIALQCFFVGTKDARPWPILLCGLASGKTPALRVP